MKIAYIAHPMGGDVKGNIDKVLQIVRELNLAETDIVPFVPYLADIMALDDNDQKQRARGIRNSTAIFFRDVIDELWLYGDRISNGMWEEIKLADKLGIQVRTLTRETAAMLGELEDERNLAKKL